MIDTHAPNRGGVSVRSLLDVVGGGARVVRGTGCADGGGGSVRSVLPAPLRADLRAMQARRGYADDITGREDAFLLDPGLGPACYLTADGRMRRDYREWVEACGPRPEWEPPVREA